MDEGKTAYAIAKLLNRSINTITNELKRGTVDQIKQGKLVKTYYADVGQAKYEANHRKSGRKYKLLECRPYHVEDREEFGHWEIDTIIGSKSKEDESLLSMVERKTRYTRIRKIPAKTAEALIQEWDEIKEEFENRFQEVFKSVTADNGSEFSLLSSLKEEGVEFYFTHPTRRSNEVPMRITTGLIRRFIPKGKKISDYSQEVIDRIEEWINGLPRKILGYKTPEEQFEAELDLIYAL